VAGLHIESHGAGPTLVLAHGFGGSARNFRPQARRLGAHYRFVLYDARGHARSAAAAGEDGYGLAQLAEDFLAVVQSTGEPRVVGGGLSMGSLTALQAALARPERFSALVLTSLPSLDDASRTWATGFAEALERGPFEEALQRFVGQPGSPLADGGREQVVLGLREHQPMALAALLRHVIARQPPLEELLAPASYLELPTLVICGAKDPRVLPGSEALVAAMPRAELVVLPEAGHVTNLEAPEAYSRVLEEFLRRQGLG